VSAIVAWNGSWAKSLRWKSKYWQLCRRTKWYCQLCISGKTHAKQTACNTDTNWGSKQDGSPAACFTGHQQAAIYRERLTARPFHCYVRPWRWSQFLRTGRRNRWPQNAPHWSSEIRRPWRLSYRPPFQGGEGGMQGLKMDEKGWLGMNDGREGRNGVREWKKVQITWHPLVWQTCSRKLKFAANFTFDRKNC